MAAPADERRRFHRIATDKALTIKSDGRQYHGKVLDVSLRGLLFELEGDWRPAAAEQVSVHVSLDQDLCCIDMDGEVAHIDGKRVGLHCLSMDLESASRLRRMVELNLADHDLLERELAQLIAN